MFEQPHLHHVRAGRTLDLRAAGAGQHLVHLSAPGSGFTLPTGWIALWLPLSGSLWLESRHDSWALAAGDMLVWTDDALHGVARSGGGCLGVAAAAGAWRDRSPDEGAAEGAVLTDERRCPREVRRLLVHAHRAARAGAAAPLRALVDAVHASQLDLRPLLARCSGRSPQARRQNLQRLLRVRHLVRHQPERKLDATVLARAASYSPHHLVRAHQAVFGETPAEYAARLRTERAWELVRHTTMPVCEITGSLGFESQSAFCRAFKRRFGVTTGQVREGAAPSLPDATPGARPERRAA